MDIIQLLRQSANSGRGRTLSADQIEYLLGAMGRMAYDRQQALLAAEGADTVVSAYIAKYGEIDSDEVLEIIGNIFEAEVIDEESEIESEEKAGLDSEDERVDASEEE